MKKTANNQTVKNHNLRYVLSVIREKELVSRAEISRITNISKSTISQLVSYLIKINIIEEYKSGESIGGRKPILLRIKPNGPLLIVVQVKDNGKIIGRCEDLTGQIIGEANSKVHGKYGLVKKLENFIKRLGNDKNILLISLALPGIISEKGDILSAVNLNWKNVPVTEKLSERFSLPILAKNATGLSAYGEMSCIEEEIEDLLYIHIDYVVGGALILNNKLHSGLLGSSLEIGHMKIDPKGKKCNCGRLGCLETKINKTAVYNNIIDLYKNKNLDTENINEDNIFNWLVNNENTKEGNMVLKDITLYLSQAIVNMINLIGPEKIIIESFLTNSEVFWKFLNNMVDKKVLIPSKGRYEIIKSRVKKQNVLLGAAAFARDYFFRSELYPEFINAKIYT